MAQVTPTQADREAAARMYRGDEIGAACCRDGSIDDTPLLQMVASHRIAHEAPLRAEIAELQAALVEHNDALRSAAEVVGREGKETNWLTFRGRVHWVLAEHHTLANTARAALAKGTDHGA